MKVKHIWWRRITPNDLFNIEKPLPPGPKGQLHLDVPNVPSLQQFFGITPTQDVNFWAEISVDVHVLSSPETIRELTFRPRPKNNRYDIQRQNINSDSSERHPAWTSAFGWPSIHGRVKSTAEAATILERDPLTILIIEDEFGRYFADFVSGGSIPASWPKELAPLFSGRSAGYIGLFNPARGLEIANALLSKRSNSDEVDFPVIANGEDSEPARPTGFDPQPRHPGRILDTTQSESSANRGGQGLGLSAPEKRAVERRAVEAAIEYFESTGWENVQDVGDFASYDLTMVRDGEVHIVEVKGTTGPGSSIILTRNEVQVHKDYHPNNALIVVSNIILNRVDPPHATGGRVNVIQPWGIDETLLTATTFRYQIL